MKRRITDGADANALDKGMLPLCIAIRVRSGYRYLLARPSRPERLDFQLCEYCMAKLGGLQYMKE